MKNISSTDKRIAEKRVFMLDKNTFESVMDYIEERCRVSGCGEKAIGHITVASSEILANIDSYAYDNGGPVEISTLCSDRRMTITFRDSGKPFDPLNVKAPDIHAPLDEREPGGLGIFLVRKLMSRVRYDYIDGQNTLTIEKDF